ncbi:MAG: HU family DNA-binding protein [Treponema sp.]|jgi:nucleoid DNA-binding protein|nr:HU family DNA-binding protein [Treponema sp.]
MSKFTRSRIWEILQSGAALKPAQARALTARIIETMAAALAVGEVIELRGLGSFETRERKAYKAHNPRTLAPVKVPPRRVVFFRPCGKLKEAVNAPKETGVCVK